MVYNVRSGTRIDFSKVQSLNGVYIANQLEVLGKKETSNLNTRKEKKQEKGQLREIKKELQQFSKVVSPHKEEIKREKREKGEKRIDGKIKTMLSYDSGAGWEKIEVEGSNCGANIENCNLNLAGRAEPQFSNLFTTKEAIGIIIGEGNVGDSLSTNANLVSVWLSRDAGFFYILFSFYFIIFFLFHYFLLYFIFFLFYYFLFILLYFISLFSFYFVYFLLN